MFIYIVELGDLLPTCPKFGIWSSHKAPLPSSLTFTYGGARLRSLTVSLTGNVRGESAAPSHYSGLEDSSSNASSYHTQSCQALPMEGVAFPSQKMRWLPSERFSTSSSISADMSRCCTEGITSSILSFGLIGNIIRAFKR